MSSKAIVNNLLPLPVGFNKSCNRLAIAVFPRTETTTLSVSFYVYHGVYWFNFDYYGHSMNSIGFVGLRNCVSSFKDTVKGLRFSLSDSDRCLLRDFVRNQEKGLKAPKGVL